MLFLFLLSVASSLYRGRICPYLKFSMRSLSLYMMVMMLFSSMCFAVLPTKMESEKLQKIVNIGESNQIKQVQKIIKICLLLDCPPNEKEWHSFLKNKILLLYHPDKTEDQLKINAFKVIQPLYEECRVLIKNPEFQGLYLRYSREYAGKIEAKSLNRSTSSIPSFDRRHEATFGEGPNSHRKSSAKLAKSSSTKTPQVNATPLNTPAGLIVQSRTASEASSSNAHVNKGPPISMDAKRCQSMRQQPASHAGSTNPHGKNFPHKMRSESMRPNPVNSKADISRICSDYKLLLTYNKEEYVHHLNEIRILIITTYHGEQQKQMLNDFGLVKEELEFTRQVFLQKDNFKLDLKNIKNVAIDETKKAIQDFQDKMNRKINEKIKQKQKENLPETREFYKKGNMYAKKTIYESITTKMNEITEMLQDITEIKKAAALERIESKQIEELIKKKKKISKGVQKISRCVEIYRISRKLKKMKDQLDQHKNRQSELFAKILRKATTIKMDWTDTTKLPLTQKLFESLLAMLLLLP